MISEDSKNHVSKADAGAQLRVQHLLIQSLADAKVKNPSYSLRAFAKKLKLSPAALSEIINGKRAISAKIAERILLQIDADPQVKDQVLSSFRAGATGKSKDKPDLTETYTKISLEQFRTVADWYHFAILSLFETTSFIGEPAFISERLGLKKHEVMQALRRLERLGMVEIDKNGRYRHTGQQFQTTDGVASSAIRLSHFQSLDLAKKSLELDPMTERDFTSLTLAIDPGKIGLAKKLIRKFYTDLASKLEVDPKGEVYMLNVGLFPLSRKAKGTTKGAEHEK